MGAAKHPTLQRLVGDVDSFAATCWGQQPRLFHSGEKFDELLSSDAIGDLLGRATRRPHFRMVRDGTTLAAHDITSSVRIGGTITSDVADTDRIAAEFARGATLVLQSLERIHSPISEFATSLRTEIGHPVQANAYLSPPLAAGLARHFDTHDVFVMQLEGSKAWEIEGLGARTLDVSDVLYIPRGCHHAATTNERHSLHLTIGVTAVTFGDVVRRAVRALDGFDGPLPLGFHTHAPLDLADAIAASFTRASARLATTDAVVVAQSEQDRARRGLEQPTRLRREFDLLRMTDASMIRRHPQVTIERDDESVTIAFGERRLRMPIAAAPALDAFVAADAITVGDLVGLDQPSRLVLARRLLREGAAT